MKLEIVGKKENKSLQRTEAEFELKDTALSPSRKELRPKIAALLNAKESMVVIAEVRHAFGAREATIFARAYDNEAALKKFELKHLIERDFAKKGEKKDAKSAPAKGESKGAESGEGEAKGEKKPEK